jgi:methionyl-tRNA formyltransferase
MRTVFFGTPALAVPALAALAETSDLVGVVCQPDRPSGRGLSLRAPPVKSAALELGVEVHQPVKVKTGTLDQWLAERRADVAVVLAYGRILPPAVLDAPRRGCMNLHASLLPRYRGAAPINWAIIEGETQTGISLMQMDAGLDTGPVYSTRSIEVGPKETAGELSERIAELAAMVVRRDLARAVSGELTAVPQDPTRATRAPPLTAEHCRLSFDAPAIDIVNRIRGLAPRPGAFTTVRGKRLKVTQALPSDLPATGPPGRVTVWDKHRVLVATGEGTLELVRGQLEGRRELGARDLANGRALEEGDQLGL